MFAFQPMSTNILVDTSARKAEYVRSLVTRWCDQIHVLSEFAKLQPQASCAAFVSGFCHRFTYYMRTIPGFETEMQQIDNVIDTKLLPALRNHHSLSRHERELLPVPTRLGGLGIPIFSNICVEENVNSKTINQYHSSNIALQNHTPAPGSGNCIQDQRREIANQREARYKSLLDNLRSSMSEEQLRANDLAQQKGSSAWLTALPLADEGYVLTTRAFYDAIYLRYRWQLKRLLSYSACGKSFTVDDALSCLKGGFIH